MQCRTSMLIAFLFLGLLARAAWAAEPENLARKAKVSASAELDGRFLAKFAVDGKAPMPFYRGMKTWPGTFQIDQNIAWCVPGEPAKFQGWFKLEWDQPVDVAEIVYYGRTAMVLEECFKNYEVYLDGVAEPVVKGTFQLTGNPQRIKIPRSTVKTVTLKFLNAYTTVKTHNPGASEIAVYSSSPSNETLYAFQTEERSPAEQQLAEDLYAEKLGFRDMLVIQRHHLQISHVYTYHVEGYRPGGGLYAHTPGPDGGTMRQLVDSSEGMIINCDLSYDAKEVVFSWKRGGVQTATTSSMKEEVSRDNPDNNYQIYRINIDGTGLTQLTDGACNNLDACWLPDGGIAFTSDRKPAYAYCFVTTSPVLYRMDRNGEHQKRLSANYLMDFAPSVLADGRIIFTRWEYVDKPAIPIQSLWAINADGTGLEGYYGNRVISPGTFMNAQPMPGTNKIIALATNHGGHYTGAICVIDRTKGANAREAVRNVTPEIDMYRVGWAYGIGLEGPYEKPYPIDGQRYLVSKMGTLELRTLDADRVSLLHPKEGLGFYSAQAIQPAEVPPATSTVRLDDSVKLSEDGSVSGSWATVMMQDVYQGLLPQVKRGEVKQVCVVQEVEKSTFMPLYRKDGGRNWIFGYQFPLVSCGATYAPKKVWGFADVAADGSACFKVPTEVPIYFMALDAEGRAVQRMRTFTHMMPGEVQGCIGCHADRSQLAPHPINHLVLSNQPQELRQPEWGVKGFSYAEVVQPVLDKYCVECHNAYEQPADIDLSGDRTDFFNVSYDILARKGTLGEWSPHISSTNGVEMDSGDEGSSPYTSWIWTLNGTESSILQVRPKQWGSPASLLAELILAGHPDEDGKPRVAVDEAGRHKVFLWIDLNVPYYPTATSNHRDRLGGRYLKPTTLDKVLAEVSGRRCVSCHGEKLPNKFYVRVTNPQLNSFLLAPLAQSAGGSERCGKPIFQDTTDPDYQAILATFEPIVRLLERRPRMDMPGAQLDCTVGQQDY